MSDFVHQHNQLVWWIAATSAVFFIGCLFVVPWLVVRIPADYFVGNHRPRTLLADRHPVIRWVGLVVKNLIGGLLILAGIAMLVLPGQGLLTLIAGVTLLNFPGKHWLERQIIRIPAVADSINWLRRRSGVGPIQIGSATANAEAKEKTAPTRET